MQWTLWISTLQRGEHGTSVFYLSLLFHLPERAAVTDAQNKMLNAWISESSSILQCVITASCISNTWNTTNLTWHKLRIKKDSDNEHRVRLKYMQRSSTASSLISIPMNTWNVIHAPSCLRHLEIRQLCEHVLVSLQDISSPDRRWTTLQSSLHLV